MKCRIEVLAFASAISFVVIRCFYTVEKPQLEGSFYNFTRSKLLNLVNDPPHPSKTTVFIVTPTYTRLTQKADLVRLCSTLKNVNFVHWIVVEDATGKTEYGNPLLETFAEAPVCNT